MDVTELSADAGRPDAAELSRVVAACFLAAVAGAEVGTPPVIAPTGSVTRVPSDALELAPGDPAGLAEAGRSWATVQADPGAALSDELVQVARDAAVAHLLLAERLVDLQERGAAVYAEGEGLGVDGATLGDAERLEARVASDPVLRDRIAGVVADLVAVRLDWVDATGAFIDDLRSARDAFGIADW